MALPFENINLQDYTYTLPESRIASYPAGERDDSLLMVYKSDGSICQDHFRNIANHLPKRCHLIFNNSRVIPARLIFNNPAGSRIELFCLTPMDPQTYEDALSSISGCEWQCMAGNLKRFHGSELQKEVKVGNITIQLRAKKTEQNENLLRVIFSWDNVGITFAQILSATGKIPLPPYIKREPDANDIERYQTIYSRHDGSVAAPTAGLHFTPSVFEQLRLREISTHEVTLHVGAGTFQPVKTDSLQNHVMHAEFIHVSKEFVAMMAGLGKPVVAIGTTSVRTLESLYWLGVKVLFNEMLSYSELSLNQWEAYELPQDVTLTDAFHALDNWLEKKSLGEIFTTTQLMIVPGYHFRAVNTLVTNFHQPGSTLLLLVAAFIGNSWKNAYQYALENGFRFLSYGDCSILFGK